MWQCANCGKKAKTQADTCAKCGRWYTLLYEGPGADTAAELAKGGRVVRAPRLCDDVVADTSRRIGLGLKEWDFAFSGGIAPGTSVLLAGEPGAGKTTAMLSIAPVMAANAGEGARALFISGEMVEGELKAYAERIGSRRDNLLLFYATTAEEAVAAIEDVKPKTIVVDSIQVFRARHYAAKTEHAVTELVSLIAAQNKRLRAVTWFLSQVNAQNWAACPRGIEHLVDAVCYLEPKKLVVDKYRGGVSRSVPREIPGITRP